MPASFQTSTGKPIEYHSAARPGVLIQTAVNNGYPDGDVEEKKITSIEYMAAVELWEASDADGIAAKLESAKEDASRKSGLAKLYKAGGLTRAEIDAQA